MTHSRAAKRYVERLSELPFVEEAELHVYRRMRGDLWDYLLNLRIGGHPRRLFVEEKRTAILSHSLVEDLTVRSEKLERNEWILFAPYISAPAGARLRSRNINYVDLAGNCFVAFDKNHTATIEGRKPAVPRDGTRGIGSAGYRVIFTLLTRPALVESSVREVAEQAGVSKSGVSLTMRRLERDGIIGRTRTRPVLARPRALLDRWLVGYETVLRPRLVYGRYTSRAASRAALDEMLDERLHHGELGPGWWQDAEGKAIRWAWGGAAAAHRLTGHFRGTETILHFSEEPIVATGALELRESASGDITFLGVPSPTAFPSPTSTAVDPLLVYSELVISKDERAIEAAKEIYERYLGHLW